MIANYHTHTFRCCHASGTEREYVETAIANGLKILGFADHAPYTPPDPVRRMRMLHSQVDDYFKVLGDLKKEYAKDIEIHIGFEAEYFPEEYAEFREFIMQYPTEYLILGQHFTPNEHGEYTGHPFDDYGFLTQYADSCIEAIETGDYTYVAHPDIINFKGEDSLYREQMLRILDAAKKADIPVEFNLLGFEDNRQYPCRRFFDLVRENGNTVIMGCDAHAAEKCGSTAIWKAGLERLAEFGITPVETVKLRNLK